MKSRNPAKSLRSFIVVWPLLEGLLLPLGSGGLAHVVAFAMSPHHWHCKKPGFSGSGKSHSPLLTKKTLATPNPAILDGIRLFFLELGIIRRALGAESKCGLVETLPKLRSLWY